MADALTPEDRRNGWTEEKLQQYLNERDASVNDQHRLGPAGSAKKPAMRIQSSQDYDPYNF